MESTLKIPRVNGDRISNLPEPIIHHILSFLETIDVIRTSIISRRWRYLWTSMPYLSFDIETVCLDDPFNRTTNEKFKDFVNWVLMSQNGSTDIQTLRLSCSNYGGDFTIYRWINIAARRNVQNLDLQIVTEESIIELPHCLVTCESLVELKLRSHQRLRLFHHCVVKLPSFAGFSGLKSLKLVRVKLFDGVLARNFISSCPLLENLSLKSCIFEGFKVLVISAKNLKKLKINDLITFVSLRHGLWGNQLEVSCPNLVAFKYRGLLPLDVSLQDLSHIQNASIYIYGCIDDVYDRDEEDASFECEAPGSVMCKLLKVLCNIKALELDLDSELVYTELAKSGGLSMSLHNLKFLKLSMGTDDYYLQLLINLLNCSPNLESLKIHFEEFECCKEPDMAIACLTYHLKMVELIDVEGSELELVKFLLKNGHVLEKMNVFWKRGLELEIQEEIMQEAMKFPRSSACVALIFLELKPDINSSNL